MHGLFRKLFGIRSRKISKRPILSDHEVYVQFFARSGYHEASVLELWHEVGFWLKIPSGQMRPRDVLSEDISPSLFVDSRELENLMDIVSERLEELPAGQREQVSGIVTVEDYINAFAKRL